MRSERFLPSAVSRRLVCKAIAASAVPILGMEQLPAQITAAVLKVDGLPAEHLLAERFHGLDATVHIDKHIPPTTNHHTVLTGELSFQHILFDHYTLSSFPEESALYDGTEVIGEKSAQKFMNGVSSSGILFSFDGGPYTSKEYWNALGPHLTESVAKRAAFVFPPVFTHYLALCKQYLSKPMDRRQALQFLGLYASSGLLTWFGKNTINPDHSDLSSLHPLFQTIYGIAPIAFVHNLRENAWANSSQSLTQLPLEQYAQQLCVYAGDGHASLINAIEEDPTSIHDTVQHTITQTLDQFADVYQACAGTSETQTVAFLAFHHVFLLFAPTRMRVNYHTASLSPDLFSWNAVPGRPVHESSPVVFIRVLKKAIDEHHEHWDFYEDLLNLYWEEFQDFDFADYGTHGVGPPLPWDASQERIDLFNLSVWIDHGFITKISL